MALGGVGAIKSITRMTYFVKSQNVEGLSNIKNLDFFFFYNLFGMINKLYIVSVIIYLGSTGQNIITVTESTEEKKVVAVERVTKVMKALVRNSIRQSYAQGLALTPNQNKESVHHIQKMNKVIADDKKEQTDT